MQYPNAVSALTPTTNSPESAMHSYSSIRSGLSSGPTTTAVNTMEQRSFPSSPSSDQRMDPRSLADPSLRILGSLSDQRTLSDQQMLSENKYYADQQMRDLQHRNTIADQRAFAEQKQLAQKKLFADSQRALNDHRSSHNDQRTHTSQQSLQNSQHTLPDRTSQHSVDLNAHQRMLMEKLSANPPGGSTDQRGLPDQQRSMDASQSALGSANPLLGVGPAVQSSLGHGDSPNKNIGLQSVSIRNTQYDELGWDSTKNRMRSVN